MDLHGRGARVGSCGMAGGCVIIICSSWCGLVGKQQRKHVLAMFTMVSITVKKMDGKSVHPMGKFRGKATILSSHFSMGGFLGCRGQSSRSHLLSQSWIGRWAPGGVGFDHVMQEVVKHAYKLHGVHSGNG